MSREKWVLKIKNCFAIRLLLFFTVPLRMLETKSNKRLAAKALLAMDKSTLEESFNNHRRITIIVRFLFMFQEFKGINFFQRLISRMFCKAMLNWRLLDEDRELLPESPENLFISTGDQELRPASLQFVEDQELRQELHQMNQFMCAVDREPHRAPHQTWIRLEICILRLLRQSPSTFQEVHVLLRESHRLCQEDQELLLENRRCLQVIWELRLESQHTFQEDQELHRVSIFCCLVDQKLFQESPECHLVSQLTSQEVHVLHQGSHQPCQGDQELLQENLRCLQVVYVLHQRS